MKSENVEEKLKELATALDGRINSDIDSNSEKFTQQAEQR
jgi:hypothetical protein